ncbi:energy transducer TonB (plasmid) [Sphingosinicella sp. BN140058]|nr:energy transducer TonB [Sphingosinicella sp. BN140058]
MISNASWTIKKEEALDLVYSLNGYEYEKKAFGGDFSGRSGFITKFKADSGFLDDLAKSTYLHIDKGEVAVDRLKMTGSAAALAQARRCLSHVKSLRAAEAREKARWADIPANPFAAPPPTQSEVVEARRKALAGIITDTDYPAAAIRAGEEGAVRAKITVGSNGRVTACEVVGSSGSVSLDMTTCRIIRSRYRGGVLRNSNGEPSTETFEETFNWKLTTPTPPQPDPAAPQPPG